jgi:allantoinase
MDIRVRSGRIVEIGRGLEPVGEEQIDAGGLTVLPGAVDPHAHQWEAGFTSPPDFRDTTASAAVGGVTTLVDHPLTPPEVLDRKGLEAKVTLGERTSSIDFALHGGASPGNLDEIDGMWTAGAVGIKLFTCRTGTALDGFEDPSALALALERVAEVGALVLVHAEDAATLDSAAASLRATGGGSIGDFTEWHSLDAEVVATDRVLSLAARTSARVYLVHVSHPTIVSHAASAQARGQVVHVETCPHYLHLTDDDVHSQGARVLTAPPVRDRVARDGLRAGLATGTIDTVGSDHCAVDPGAKSGATMDAIIPGIPSLDIYLPLLLDLVADGVIDLPRLAEVTASAPARIFGLHRKGAIEVGRDADLALVDPNGMTTVDASRLPGSAGWSPYEGRTLRGAVVATWSRGVLVARDGVPTERAGHGRFVRRTDGAVGR